jgi:antibiotic biosynthesis monooxygenase (ABM) superfamily enzyme
MIKQRAVNNNLGKMNNEQNKSAKPKSWKLMLIAFVFVYLTMNVLFFLLGSFLFALPQLIRTLVMAVVLVPLFGVGIPTLHKKFYRWTIK